MIMISYLSDQILTYDKAIAQLRLIDDDFMRIVFKDRDCLELILSIILERSIHIRDCILNMILKIFLEDLLRLMLLRQLTVTTLMWMFKEKIWEHIQNGQDIMKA